jgi:hypothetical protein
MTRSQSRIIFIIKKFNFFRQAYAKQPTGYGKTAERGFDGQKSKVSEYFRPEAKEVNSEAQSKALDDDSWGNSEYDFEDDPKKSTGKTPESTNNGADGMNILEVSENRHRHSSPSPKLDLKGLTIKEKDEKDEKKVGERKGI